jgi:hypothetical protein
VVVALAQARPWEVASLGLRLLQASSAVADAQSAALSSPALRWRGRAAEAFEGRLGRVARLLPNVEEAYDAAARVLLRYAVELEECSLLARRAAERRVDADRLSAASSLPGPDPGEALRWEAARWEAQAEALHDAASRRAVAELRELTAAAPEARDGASRDRFWSDVRSSVSGQVASTGALFVTSADALAGNRAARDDLVAVAKQSWRVWEPFAEVWQQLDDDRGGLAVGSAGGLIGLKGVGPVRPGTLNLVRPVDLAWSEARQENGLRHLVDKLGLVQAAYRPGDAGMTLYGQEGVRSHGVRQHVSKSHAFVRWRADNHPSGAASSFPDGRVGQEALDEVFRRHRADVDQLYFSDVGSYLPIVIDMGKLIGTGFVKGDPDLRSTSRVYAGFRREQAGVVLVTIYPEVR